MIRVKTSYTVEEFASYLSHSILRDSAEPLGWGPYQPYVPPGIEVKTVVSNTNDSPSVLTLSAGLTNAAPAGTTIITDDGLVAVTLNNEAAGATVIEIDLTLTTNAWASKEVAFIYRGPTFEILNPKFTPVVDEALRQMGLEDIELINSSNVYEFRVRGRLELLRRIAEDRAYQYDYTTNIGVLDVDGNPVPEEAHRPSDITNHMLRLYQDELVRYNYLLHPPTLTTVEVVGVPEESNSSSAEATITW